MTFEITVITPTIGRRSIYKLASSLRNQNVKIIHIILWDSKRCNDNIEPYDKELELLTTPNYSIYHYVISHPIYNILRIDNYMRIVGLSMTTTEYVTQLGDDCWVEPDWLERGINYIKKGNNIDYIFCRRYIWENENTKMGVDDYESIGKTNKFGYNLMENDSIIYTKRLILPVINVLNKNNHYYSDREITKELLKQYNGLSDTECGLNQISPDFLIQFHKTHITKYN
jgi:hypothetical protein